MYHGELEVGGYLNSQACPTDDCDTDYVPLHAQNDVLYSSCFIMLGMF